ncbi:NUDIX domain-containing protein [Candidatus Parcubacteria bacterium]|nr:NUDIX domain-containing protein [Candidatus Parcubacteria bacterium]
MNNKEFEVCVRAIIQYQNKILVCKHKEKDYYFFPGGHINFGESAKETLLREMKEELDLLPDKCKFIGAVENFFVEDNENHHEINLVFGTEVEKINAESKENHISFVLMDRNQFSQENILPIALKKAILKWLKDKKIFWASQIYNQSIL